MTEHRRRRDNGLALCPLPPPVQSFTPFRALLMFKAPLPFERAMVILSTIVIVLILQKEHAILLPLKSCFQHETIGHEAKCNKIKIKQHKTTKLKDIMNIIPFPDSALSVAMVPIVSQTLNAVSKSAAKRKKSAKKYFFFLQNEKKYHH